MIAEGESMRWRRSVELETSCVRPRSSRAKSYAGIGSLVAVLVAWCAAWTALAFGVVPGAGASTSAAEAPVAVIEATTLPPLLTVDADHVDVLRYDIACVTDNSDTGSGCVIDGTVFVRPGQTGGYRPVPLQFEHLAEQGRYGATLPADIRDSPTGFSYYAVIRDQLSGATVTLPAGGARAPQRSIRLPRPFEVDLGTHRFGDVSPADARVAQAAWGNGPAEPGIEEGPELQPIGASSFDVDTAGAVTVLDEAHRRLLRFTGRGADNATPVPLDIRGTIASVVARPDGGTYVLESVADQGQAPLLRSFDSAGHPVGSWHAAQPGVGSLRLSPTGPQSLEYPAGQWMSISPTDGIDAAESQLASGRPGRRVAGGREIVVQREGAEARIAVTAPSGVLRSWQITSATPLAEIQLAELRGNDVVVVLRTYTESQSEFVVLVLGDRGAVRQFAIDAAAWAETAPLARFRLVGSSLYCLGSTPSGMFVDRYDLEVH